MFVLVKYIYTFPAIIRKNIDFTLDFFNNVNLSTQIKEKISMELPTASYRLKFNLY